MTYSNKFTLVYRRCIVDNNAINFEDSEKKTLEIKSSSFFIKEKYGGDIFDELTENEENILPKINSLDISYKHSNDKRVDYIFDTNNVADLKHLIFKNLFNIPVEFMYLEAIDEYGSESALSHYYKYTDRSLQNIQKKVKISELKEIVDDDDTILNINIDKELYYSRNLFIVKMIKQKIKNIIDKSVNTIYVYNMLDIIDSICGVSNFINYISKDIDNLNLAYYGFVEKYFPYISINNLESSVRKSNIYHIYNFLSENQLSSVYRKINIVEFISNQVKKIDKKIEKKIEIKNIRIVYTPSILNNFADNIHILKLFNSLDLRDDVVKINAYIKHKNMFLEKVKNNKSLNIDSKKLKLSEIQRKKILSKGMSYITFFISNKKNNNLDEFTIFSDKSIEAVVFNNNNNTYNYIFKEFINLRLPNIYNYVRSYVDKDADLYISLTETQEYATCQNLSFHQNIDIKPTINTYSELKSILFEFELLEDYRVSQSDSLKESIHLFLSKRDKTSFKVYDNEFHEYLDNKLDNNNNFHSKENIIISPRINDLSITYNNIHIDDYTSYIYLCNVLLEIYRKSLSKKINNEIINYSSKRIKILKQSDPLLFNSENSEKDSQYSRLCQSKQQPLIISKELSKSNKYKNKSVKFWNFTKGREEYYTCDSKEYPHLKFITGNHPSGYCLPCCKKKLVDNSEDSISSYKEKHMSCLSTYTYNKKESINTNNRYISLYSCRLEIEENRLMKISNTMNKLFNTYKKEEKENLELFILGISPFNNTFKSYIIKILSRCIFNNYDSSVDVILMAIDIVHNNQDIIFSLDNGNIVSVFSNSLEFIDFLYDTISSDNIIKHSGAKYLDNEWIEWINWDNVFMDIFSINNYKFIQLNETDNESVNDSTIEINKNSILNDNSENIIILVNRNINKDICIYPIVSVQISEFYSEGNISRFSFNQNSNIITSLSKIINLDIKQNYNKSSQLINIQFILTLLEKKFKIDAVFTNSMNYIFCILLEYKNKFICFHTEYINVIDAKKYFTIKNIKNNSSVINYIKNYDLSLENINILVKQGIGITHSFINKDNKYLGGILNNLYIFYINDNNSKTNIITHSKIIYTDNISLDYSNLYPSDFSLDNINKALYHTNIYNILLSHINNKLSKKINTDIRVKVKDIFINNIKSNFITQEEITLCFVELNKLIEENDTHRIVYGFVNTFNSNISKKGFNLTNKILLSLDFLDTNRYYFDKNIDNILTVNDVREFVSDIIIIENNTNTDLKFDMNLGVCSNKNSYYCKEGKVIVSREIYDDIVNILLNDLTNDYKKKYILKYNEIQSSHYNTDIYIEKHNNSIVEIYEL